MTTDPAAARARDDDARRRAQRDFDAPLVVEAGAGSGKTSILVARIVAWSLGPGWERSEAFLRDKGRDAAPDLIAQRTLSRVVAITFTEAAAAEMAGRVGRWFGAIAAGELPREIDASALPEPELRLARAQVLRSALDRLVVRTIHAFCRRLLAERPLDIGLHPAFEVDADEERTGQLVREVVEHAIPLAYADRAAPLSRLAALGYGPSAVENALRIFVLAGARANLLEEDPLAPGRVAPFLARLRDAADRFVTIEQGRLLSVGGPRSRAAARSVHDMHARLGEASEATPDGLAQALDALGDVWEDASVGHLRSKWGKGDFGKGDKAEIGADAEDLAQVALLLHGRLKHALTLDLELLELARRALAPLARELEERMRASGIETFAALLDDARALVASQPRAAERVRQGIDQLLVDEFQDTDAIQCEIVGRLGLEGEADRRPTLFLVGDPRQSIYGWRSADLRAYDAFVGRVEQAGGERLHLSRNFRSLPAVLDEVGRCIAPIMQEEPGVQPPFQALLPERAGEGEPGCVEHWVSWDWDAAARAPQRTHARAALRLEAQALAEDVARLGREGTAWADVALLLRGMTDVDAYLDALRDAGVPYTVERDRRYYMRREVIEASALLRSVLDPHDHVALVAWLRSASVGVPDAAWTPLWVRGFPAALSRLQPEAGAPPERLAERLAALRGLIADAVAAIDPGLPGLDRIRGFERTLVEAVATLAELRTALHTEPADRFIERLRTATLIEVTEASRYLGPYRVANLDQFFRDVREDLEETGGDVSEVLRRIRVAVENQAEVEEARPREAADDAVRVMSIHKAKGLDFRHVYLAQLHKGHGGGGGESARLGRGDDDAEYELFGAPTLGFDAAAEQRSRIEAAERVRTLYVAMTRACDRLVLLGKHPMGGDALKDSHAALIADRRAAARAPDERMAGLAREDSVAGRDEQDVLWRFPGIAPAAAPRADARRAPPALPEADEVADHVQVLAGWRERAERQSAAPWSAVASSLSHEASRERLHALHFPEDGDLAAPSAGAPPVPEARDAERAAVVGTAVHAALEHWPDDATPEAGLAAARDVAASALSGLVGSDAAELAAAREEADAILAAFVAGPLFEPFRTLGERRVARELPVLLAPTEADGALGYVSGAVDLLYRDAETGELVVADYKSDAVGTAEESRKRAERYAGQGEAYVRAVREALDLAEAPRFELWFLASGERVTVTTGG